MIYVDSREPQIIVKKLRDSVGEDKVRITKLNYGDYMVVGAEDDIKYIIERKTVNDLKSSIQSGRLWKQMAGLMMYDDNFRKIVLIEGMPYLQIKKGYLDWHRWIAWKTALIEGYGVIVYESAKMEETVYFLRKLNERVENKAIGEGKSVADKIQFEMPTELERGKIVGETVEGEIVGVLVGIKGIGVKSALSLLKTFGSLRDIFNAREEELVKVVGKKKGEKVWQVANRRVKIAEEVM